MKGSGRADNDLKFIVNATELCTEAYLTSLHMCVSPVLPIQGSRCCLLSVIKDPMIFSVSLVLALVFWPGSPSAKAVRPMVSARYISVSQMPYLCVDARLPVAPWCPPRPARRSERYFWLHFSLFLKHCTVPDQKGGFCDFGLTCCYFVILFCNQLNLFLPVPLSYRQAPHCWHAMCYIHKNIYWQFNQRVWGPALSCWYHFFFLFSHQILLFFLSSWYTVTNISTAATGLKLLSCPGGCRFCLDQVMRSPIR